MQFYLVVLFSTPAVVAYDAVVFSNDQQVTKDYPTIENMVFTASASSPLVFIVNPDFALGQFSKHALAFSLGRNTSGFPATVKSSAYHSDRYYSDVIRVPGAMIVKSNGDFVPNANVYVLEGTEWTSMELLAQEFLPRLGRTYTAIITATEGVSTRKDRVKRVATSEMGDDASSGVQESGGPDVKMPMNLPPYNRTEYPNVKPLSAGLGSCLLYLEGVNIVVQNSKKMFATIPIRSMVNTTTCFVVRLKLKGDVTDAKQQIKISSGSQVIFKLVFTATSAGYWELSDVESAKAESKAISASVDNVGFKSVVGFAIACSDSQAAFFKTDQDGVLIGISLYNTEIQTVAVYPDPKTKQMYFTRQVDDCIGTFSTGSWMGIVSTLILLSGFLFGYLMLNSVQTMDRFDDPKHKQIVINVRE
uniref:Ac45-VOA1_TM domain-containing protein n=1 Tax=Angiostrongylus cantonensis TaxID=6313 RepID=A0A0K0D479_ANGCA